MKLKEIINLFDKNDHCCIKKKISGVEFITRTMIIKLKENEEILNKQVESISVHSGIIHFYIN